MTQFLYNGAGLPEMIRKADGTERLFGYDSEERCISRRDENGNTIRICHNLDGSMVQASGTPEGSAVPSISSTYRYDERGFLTSAAEGNTAYRYKRDSEGRVTEKSDSRGKLFEMRYNPDGTIDRLGETRYYYILTTDEICREYRANRKAVYFLMRLCASYYTERSVLSTAQYNYAGQLTCVMPDGGTGANYEYDNNGVLIRTECHNGLTTTYAYDSMNRLTMESRNGLATAYTYDMAGNRIRRTKGDDREEYRYNSRNQLTELTGAGKRTHYQYDPAGNLTQEQRFIQERSETRNYIYDAYNRNTEVRGEGFTHRNFYDAEGLRNRIEENGKATDFVYSGDMLYSEKEESGTTERRYILENEYLGHEDLGRDVTFAGEN